MTARWPALLAFGISPCIGQAQGRWSLVNADTQVVVAYDRQTISRTDAGTYMAWFRHRYLHLQGDDSVAMIVTREELDCPGGRSRDFESILYDSLNHVIKTWPAPEKPRPWQYMPPETNGETELRRFCEERPKKKGKTG